MKLEKQEVIKELQTITERQIHHLEQWALLDKEMLNQQPSNGGWSVLECMEHLRRYMEVYLPEIKAAIEKGRKSDQEYYRTGWIGNYSAQSMLPDHKRSRKMKTFASKNPEGEQVDKEVLMQLKKQLMQLQDYLERSLPLNWNRIRVKTTLSSLIRFKLGDIFRFLIYHNLRHFEQAKKVAKTTV